MALELQVVGLRCAWVDFLVDEILPGDVVALGRGGEVDGRRGAHGRRLEEHSEQAVHQPEGGGEVLVFEQSVGAHRAGVQAVDRHVGGVEAAGQVVGEEHVGELRAVVGEGVIVPVFEGEVV